MANILAISTFTLAVIVMLACLWIWTALMLPKTVERAERYLYNELKQSALFGVLGLLGTGLALLVFAAVRTPMKAVVIRALDRVTQLLDIGDKSAFGATITQYFGWLLVAPIALAFVIGGAAFTRMLAARMRIEGSSVYGLRLLFASAFVISLAIFLPIIGWLFCLPAFVLLASGAGFHALFRRGSAQPNKASAAASSGETAR